MSTTDPGALTVRPLERQLAGQLMHERTGQRDLEIWRTRVAIVNGRFFRGEITRAECDEHVRQLTADPARHYPNRRTVSV